MRRSAKASLPESGGAGGAGAKISRRSLTSTLLSLGVLPLMPAATLAAEPIRREPRFVFAHYMVCCPMAGHNGTVAQFAQEIRQAWSAGVEGFALNCGSWTAEPYYRAIATRIFEAAASLPDPFKLFFSSDGLTPEETASMVSEFYDHPNMLRYQGKPVLSSYSGDDAWGKAVIAALAGLGRPVVFVPFFFPKGFDQRFTDANIARLTDENRYADGFFYFGADGTGADLAATSVKIGRAWRDAGKLYMAPVTPFYRGLGPRNYRVFETRGLESMAREWEAAIAADAQWVEIVTWNDWGESTYVASFGPPEATELWDGHWGPLLSHEAYLAASAYYIRWFKTGVKQIESDDLFWFYRLSPKRLAGRDRPDHAAESYPRGFNHLKDRVFLTTFLVAPAILKVQSGERQYAFNVPAGVAHLSADFSQGPQRFSVERSGVTTLSGTGAFPISDDNWGNFNYLAGQAKRI
jgi:glucan endo-1,3-alpha-glucosidase